MNNYKVTSSITIKLQIYAKVHVDNFAYWKALEKNGFLREGLSSHCFNVPSILRDCYIYAELFACKS